MDSDVIIMEVTDSMDKTLENLEKRLGTVRAGRANPSSLDGVFVEYYGSMTPLKQLATISVPEARQLLIKPFDKSSLGAIEKAILASNLGYNPGNDGETIRIVIPELTEERRRELAKQVKLPEDEKKALEKDIQDLVNEYNRKIEAKLKEKEQELLTV